MWEWTETKWQWSNHEGLQPEPPYYVQRTNVWTVFWCTISIHVTEIHLVAVIDADMLHTHLFIQTVQYVYIIAIIMKSYNILYIKKN